MPRENDRVMPPEEPLPEIAAPREAKLPAPLTLTGRIVTLAPLDAERDSADLYEATHTAGTESLWQYLFDGPFPDRASFAQDMRAKAAARDPLFFAILDRATGRTVGRAALMRMEPAHRTIEVGNILYAPAFQKTAGATEAMYLLARHIFEDLGYRRYEWKCDARNEPSRRAALRLGFTFEGIFRQHYIVKGRNRDTAWYSMLDREWPSRKQAFESWLDPANFDVSGTQLQRLSEC